MISRRSLPAVLIVAAVAAACPPTKPKEGPGPLLTLDKTSALAAANANLRSVLVGGAGASGLIGRAAILDTLAAGSGICTLDGAEGENSRCVNVELQRDAEALADEMAARVLNALNVETEEATRLVLKLDAERACDGENDCIRAFTDVPVRLELTSRIEHHIDVALLADDARLRVAAVKLYPNEVSVELDLGLLKSAMGDFLKAAGADEAALPETLRGRVRFALERLAEREYAASFHVLSSIEIGMSEPAVEVLIENASPMFALRFDEDGEEIEVASHINAITGRLPLGSLIEDESATEVVAFRLGEARSTASLNLRGDGAIVIENLNPAEGSVTVGGLPLFSFNSSAQKMVVRPINEGVRFEVSPSLNVRAAFDLQNLAARVSDVPSWLMNEELSLKLEGAAEPTVEFTDAENMIKMLAGSMNIHSRAAGRTVNVATGECLVVDERAEDDPARHPIELLSSGLCR